MKWKSKKPPPPQEANQIVDNKKQSISSTQSMPFLRDDNLTFHRFTTHVPLDSSRRPSNDTFAEQSAPIESYNTSPSASTSAAVSVAAAMTPRPIVVAPSSATKSELLSQFAPVWTTTITTNGSNAAVGAAATAASSAATFNQSTATATRPAHAAAAIHDPPMYKNSYTMESHDFQYLASSSRADSVTTDRRKSMQNGSTAKLMLSDDDQANKQSKCSLLRGVILCLCLNFTYANVVRFPRELERYGIAFLVPYCTILLLIGLPVILLEIALGQFLGQGSAHAWRASPILKGASLLGRIACWLGAVWTSLQAVIAVLYVSELAVRAVPFAQCASKVRLEAATGYVVVSNDGQQCLQHMLQAPVWEHGLTFALLAVGLAIVWLLAMLCTYSSRCLRRSVYVLGLASLAVLATLAGWTVTDLVSRVASTTEAISSNTTTSSGSSSSLADSALSALMHRTWRDFNAAPLAHSSIWFAALVQVLASTGIGVGVWPVLTGKFLYKGDAVRTAMVYMCFNIFVCSLAAVFFVTQYSAPRALAANVTLPDLKPLTAIYDAATTEPDPVLARLVPAVAFVLVVLVALLSMAIAVYSASRFVQRHPNCILAVLGLVAAVLAVLFAPRYAVARVLDAQVIGVFAVCALIFDVVSITWIYGVKNIYTDLEFSIGRPILKTWVLMWCLTPVLLTGLLAWWASAYGGGGGFDAYGMVPRWAPIVLALAVVALVACVQVYEQVDYNCCSMMQEAAQASTDWGPADPIVRHAWKQWRSVCEDTGQKDFTLRRRGTRDYTHSIKKGQYSRGKYGSASAGGGSIGIGAGATGAGVGASGADRVDGSLVDGLGGRKSSSVGSNSPNYSGSVFEDSAIEEDVSVEKFAMAGASGSQRPRLQAPSSYGSEFGESGARSKPRAPEKPVSSSYQQQQQHQLQQLQPELLPSQKQYFYVPSLSLSSSTSTSSSGNHQASQPASHVHQHSTSYLQPNYHNVSKIEIGPEANGTHLVTTTGHSNSGGHNNIRHPLARMATAAAAAAPFVMSGGGSSAADRITIVNGGGQHCSINSAVSNSPYATRRHRDGRLEPADANAAVAMSSGGGASGPSSADHICWRKFSVNSQEFSTEL